MLMRTGFVLPRVGSAGRHRRSRLDWSLERSLPAK